MNPLDRETRRRRRIAGRLAILVLPLVIATAGVVRPAVVRHEESASRAQDSTAQFAEQIRAVADLIEFKRTYATRLTAAEERLREYFAAGSLPIDFRSTTKERLEGLGVTIHEVEPVVVQGEPGPEESALPFRIDRVQVTATMDFRSLPAILDAIERDTRPAVVEQIDLRRGEESLQSIDVRFGIAYLSREE